MYTQLWETIEKAHNIVLISHINPDGDALGSSLALYPVLKKMGKNVIIYNTTKELPKKFDFLPYFDKIKHIFPNKCDLLISFDCGSFKRLGIEKGCFTIINIDHHKSNTMYGDINLVKKDYASCSMIVHKLIKDSGKELTKESAVCIYTALVEDTGFFSYESVNQEVFQIASDLVQYGVNPAYVSKKVKERNSLAKVRLTAEFINSIKLIKSGTISVSFISQETLKKCGAVRNESEHLVNIARSLATVRMSIFLLEEKDGTIKVSLRSKNDIDVSKIASKFGGGGHMRSAGFESQQKNIENIVKKIVNEVNL